MVSPNNNNNNNNNNKWWRTFTLVGDWFNNVKMDLTCTSWQTCLQTWPQMVESIGSHRGILCFHAITMPINCRSIYYPMYHTLPPRVQQWWMGPFCKPGLSIVSLNSASNGWIHWLSSWYTLFPCNHNAHKL